MKVLLIDVNCKNSSTGQIVYNIYSYLNNNGIEAAVCYGRGAKIKENNIFKFGLDLETWFHAMMTRLTGYMGYFSFFSTKRLIKFIKKFKPDIVHLHEIHSYFVNVNTLLSFLKKNNIKTILTLHCEFFYTGKCGHSFDCEKWKTQCTKCPRKKDYPKSLFFDKTRFMFNQKKRLLQDFPNLIVTAPSQWLADRAKQSFLKNRKIVCIPNGIDINIFCPQDASDIRRELDIKQDEKVVLSVAPHIMNKSKGGKYVLEIAEKLQNEPMKFILVGADGIQKEEQGNIIKFGPIYDKSRLAKLYSLADMFLICSQKENFPTTCLEAQCCGTPIYGFDTGGTKETSIYEENRFVDYEDVNSLVKIIAAVPLKNDKVSATISELAKQKYGNKAMSTSYIALYNELYEYEKTK